MSITISEIYLSRLNTKRIYDILDFITFQLHIIKEINRARGKEKKKEGLK